MEDLSKKKCVPCDGGIPSFNLGDMQKSRSSLMQLMDLLRVTLFLQPK